MTKAVRKRDARPTIVGRDPVSKVSPGHRTLLRAALVRRVSAIPCAQLVP